MTRIQFCPKCGSKNIRESTLIPMGDPIKAKGYLGWECLEFDVPGGLPGHIHHVSASDFSGVLPAYLEFPPGDGSL